MWHSNNEDFLRSINNCCHNTKMWQENGKEFYSIFYSCATKEDQKKTLIFTFFMFQKLMLTVNIGCGTRIGNLSISILWIYMIKMRPKKFILLWRSEFVVKWKIMIWLISASKFLLRSWRVINFFWGFAPDPVHSIAIFLALTLMWCLWYFNHQLP